MGVFYTTTPAHLGPSEPEVPKGKPTLVSFGLFERHEELLTKMISSVREAPTW
jgi:hypothetical protein